MRIARLTWVGLIAALGLLCGCGSDDSSGTSATGGAAGGGGSAAGGSGGSAASGGSAGAATGGSGGAATGGQAGSGGAAFVDPTAGVSPAQKVAGGFSFTEGPVWLAAQGKLLFTDIPKNRIHELTPPSSVKVFREPSGNANGLGVDPQGLLIACEHSGRRVSRTESGGQLTALATKYTGKDLNSPNDVIVRSDGTIYFTDPPYGGNPNDLGFQGVYRIDPKQGLDLVSKDMFRPNGIALSPDEKTLYVTDSEEDYVRSHAVDADGTTQPPKKLMDTSKGPDGMAVDDQGYLYVTTSAGVEVYTPAGKLHDTLSIPEQPANCTFGGTDRKTLYVTARTSLYRIEVNVPGLP